MKHKAPARPPTLTDEEIIALFEARDEHAIAACDGQYRTLLHTVARRILPDDRDREECLNDTYLAVWNAIPPAHPTSLRAYLAQAMRRTAIDRYHASHAARRPPAALTAPLEDYADLLSGGDAPDEAAHAEAVGRLISDFLRTRSERSRYIFMERFYLYESVPAIARALGIGESAVYKELTRTKQALKAYLAENGVYV